MYRNSWIAMANCSKDIKKAFKDGLVPDITIYCCNTNPQTAVLARDGKPLSIGDVVSGLTQMKSRFPAMDVVSLMIITDDETDIWIADVLDTNINEKVKNNTFTEQDFLDLPWEEVE